MFLIEMINHYLNHILACLFLYRLFYFLQQLCCAEFLTSYSAPFLYTSHIAHTSILSNQLSLRRQILHSIRTTWRSIPWLLPQFISYQVRQIIKILRQSQSLQKLQILPHKGLSQQRRNKVSNLNYPTLYFLLFRL